MKLKALVAASLSAAFFSTVAQAAELLLAQGDAIHVLPGFVYHKRAKLAISTD